ncbi:hypothetical protein [Rhodococcus sp. 077-4]|uniref:hypothetical protein n=1 Tax=Rhodococcus sp. 077-4 TaxID=2789271 RepID=UPI0039F529DD
MKRVIRGALVVALVAPLSVALTFARPGVAHACSCVYYTDGTQAEQQVADFASGDNAVFTGTAVAERREDFTVYYDFDVREIFRGDVGAKTTVSTASEGSACGTTFDLKEEYLVFATTYGAQNAQWAVDSCSATTISDNELTRAATVKQFGEPRELTADDGTSPVLIALIGVCAVAAVAAGAAGWSLWRARH